MALDVMKVAEMFCAISNGAPKSSLKFQRFSVIQVKSRVGHGGVEPRIERRLRPGQQR